MGETAESKVAVAKEVGGEQITPLLHDASPQVSLALLQNPNLAEEHVLIIASRKNVPAEILETIFHDKRWAKSYPVKLALARNPRTPSFIALSVARVLRLFDLADLARNNQLPALYRKKIQTIVIEKIPTLPLGVKKTLARTATDDILLALLQDGYPEVVRICLDNPHLVEAHLYKVISRETTSSSTIRTISDHAGWCRRSQVKFALVRNAHAPLSRVAVFLSELKLYDLRELYRDPLLPSAVRPAIHRELLARGTDPDRLSDADKMVVYDVDEPDRTLDEAVMTGDDSCQGTDGESSEQDSADDGET